MTNQEANCNCNNTCDIPQKKKMKTKGLLGLIAAMAICCLTPLAIGLVVGGGATLPFLVWFGS